MAQITLNSSGVASSGSLLLQTNGTTTQATVDTSGNMGLGVTPSAWAGAGKILEAGAVGNGVIGWGASDISLCAGGYYNAGWKWAATNSLGATHYEQYSGAHYWSVASPTSHTAGNALTFTTTMTLDASGNLGVGTTSPSSSFGFSRVLEIAGTTAAIVINPSNTTSGGGVEVKGAAPLRFTTNNSEAGRFDSSGNLLVGQTTQSGTTVGTSINPTGVIRLANASSTNSATTWETYSTGAGAYRFYVGFGGQIYATNTSIAGISDVRLKENIRDLDDGLASIMALQPRKFDWKEGKGADIKNARGFIAQEFEQVFPDLIDEWKDEAPEGEEPYKSVRADLIPVLVKAIQEQQAIITALTARIEALEQA